MTHKSCIHRAWQFSLLLLFTLVSTLPCHAEPGCCKTTKEVKLNLDSFDRQEIIDAALGEMSPAQRELYDFLDGFNTWNTLNLTYTEMHSLAQGTPDPENLQMTLSEYRWKRNLGGEAKFQVVPMEDSTGTRGIFIIDLGPKRIILKCSNTCTLEGIISLSLLNNGQSTITHINDQLAYIGPLGGDGGQGLLDFAVGMTPFLGAADLYFNQGKGEEALIAITADATLFLPALKAATTAQKITRFTIKAAACGTSGYRVIRGVVSLHNGSLTAGGAGDATLGLLELVLNLRGNNLSAVLNKLRPRVSNLAKKVTCIFCRGKNCGPASTLVRKILGTPGPGIDAQDIEALQNLADTAQRPIVAFGSRQTGISRKSNRPFRPDSDIDLGVLDPEDLLSDILAVESVVKKFSDKFHHCPMCIFDSAEDAVRQGYLVVYPLCNGK